jgi:phytoene dehydrogenase-like protein
MKAVVIGSGMAGLTSAAYLVRAGYQATVYEQYEELGGVTTTLQQGGFGWDLGPFTPEDFRARTQQEHHSLGGAAPVMGQEAPPHHTPVKGLWFIGSQSASGAGVAPVIAGTGKVVVQQILNRG